MDSPLSTEEAVRSADAGEHGRVAGRRLFAARDDTPESLCVSEPDRKVGPTGPPWNRRTSWISAGLLGVATVAVLAGYARQTTRNVQNSVTTRIPDAAAAGAAVKSLPPPNLLKPVSPEEAVKENAERPFVNRADTAASRFVLKTDAEDRGRALTCLTQAVYYEAASEGMDGGRAVAQVVLNRLRHPGYPASICGVVYQGSDRPSGCQFTFTCDGSLLRPHVDSLWKRSQKIAEDALSGHVFAPIGHATHYHADYVLPYWADSLDKTVQIGRHIFYRLRGAVGDGRAFFQRYAGVEPPLPEPRPAILAAPVPDPEQLAKAVIGEDSKGVAQNVEKVALAASPLVADANRPILIADEQAPAIKSHRAKPANECAADADRRKLAPLGANDLRSVAAPTGC